MIRTAAGATGAAEAEGLFGLAATPRPKIAKVSALLARMRSGGAEAGVGSEDRDARLDFDAALRGHGARLEEMINPIGR